MAANKRKYRYGRLILGDIIVAMDGQPIGSSDDLFKLLESHQVNDRIRLRVIRDHRKEEFSIKLQAL